MIKMSQLKSDNNLENERNTFEKITHMPSPFINNFQDNKNQKKIELKKVKVILPNLSKSNILISNDRINIDDNSFTINNNKDINNTVLKNTPERNNIKIKKYLNLNKSVSFPSLNRQNILLNEKKINEYSSKKFLDFSSRNLSKSYNFKKNMLNNKIQQNKHLLKSSLSNNYIRLDKNLYRSQHIIFKKIKYDNSKTNKDLTKSTFQISKIKLNESISDKKLKLKTNLSYKNVGSTNFFRSDLSIIDIPKHSRFFKISQNNSVSARRVYNHYLRKSREEKITQPIKNYKRFFDDKSRSFLQKLSRIYCENKNFLSIVKELKDNNRLAYKKDFDIEEYQSTIIELMDQRVSQKYIFDLQNEYRALNKKLDGVIEPKGRFTLLAEKLRYNLPSYLLEKMRKLDKEAILSRMKYYNKFKYFRKGNKLRSRFNENSNDKNKNSLDNNKEKDDSI